MLGQHGTQDAPQFMLRARLVASKGDEGCQHRLAANLRQGFDNSAVNAPHAVERLLNFG
jgi:hypothetical protein